MPANPPPDDDVPETIVFARRYEMELASRKQFSDFDAWLKRENITNLSAYHLDDRISLDLDLQPG